MLVDCTYEFHSVIGNNEFTIDDEDQVMPGRLSSRQDAAISLPASLFQNITDREDVGIFFALYNTSTLFPVDGGINRNASRRREMGSRVLAATVGPGLNFQNLTENVTIVLRRTTEYVSIHTHRSHAHSLIMISLYSLQHQVQRCVSLGVLLFRTGRLKVALPILVKMGLSLVAAITLQTLLFWS